MIFLSKLFVSVLTITRLASVQASGAVLVRDKGEAPFPEPLVFQNLTMDEYMAKLRQHRGASRTKRVVVGGEELNSADQQALVEEASTLCRDKYGAEYRIRRSTCVDEQTIINYCDRPSDDVIVRPRKVTRLCPKSEKQRTRCEWKQIKNHRGNLAKIAYCADVIPIKEKDKEVDAVPQYDGYKTMPWEAWSPGSIDAFYEMTGTPFPGLTGNFEYRGHYSSGQEFRSLSPRQAHSWACLDCPSGTLYVSTVGFMSEAVGFNVPAGSWY